MTKKRLFYSNGHLDPVQVWLAVILLLIIMVFALVLYLMLFEDNPPATINNVNYEVQEVYPGESINYTLDWCKHTSSPVTVSRAWIGTFLEIQPPQAQATGTRPVLGPGCYTHNIRVPIPDLSPGEHRMKVSYIYEVNPLSVRTVSYELEPIIVLEQ